MTFDPDRRLEENDRVVGYGADRSSAGFYAVLALGVLVAFLAIFYLIGHVGGSRTMNANNPSETKTTTGVNTPGLGTPERTQTPAQSPPPPRQ